MADWRTTHWGAALAARFATSGMDKRLPLVAMLLLVALLAQSLAQLTWKLIPTPPQAAFVMPSVPAASATQAEPSHAGDIARIAQWHLLGEFKKAVPLP